MTVAVTTEPAKSTPLRTHRSRQATIERVMLIVLQIIMTLVLISFLAPTIWMVSSALKDRNEIFAVPIVWIPTNPQWQNFTEALTTLPFARFAVNTFVICILTCDRRRDFVVDGGVFLRPPEVARSRLFFGLLLATMMLPEIVTLIPMFLEFRASAGQTRRRGVLPLNYLLRVLAGSSTFS